MNGRRRRESPVPRINPSGRKVWVARYTNREGRRVSAGTFALRRDAQAAINRAYDEMERRPRGPLTLGEYAETWTARHPRAPRTNYTNDRRLHQLLPVEVDGLPLGDWPLADLRRRHVVELVDHLLRAQGRAHTGAQNLIRTLSALFEDAIDDDECGANPARGVRVRASDPRVTGARRPARVFAFAELHAFAACAGAYEPMIRTFTDTGMRLGEVLALERAGFDGEWFELRGSAHEGEITAGDQETKRHVRRVPCPPTLAGLIRAMPARIDTPLLFPTPAGRVWRASNFRRQVWQPALAKHLGIVRREGETSRAFALRAAAEIQQAGERAIRPQDCRHSYVTHLRAAGIDPADLADVAGHTVETATTRYTHPLRRSAEQIREVVG